MGYVFNFQNIFINTVKTQEGGGGGGGGEVDSTSVVLSAFGKSFNYKIKTSEISNKQHSQSS